MRLGGQALAAVMDLAIAHAAPGMTTHDLDAFIEAEMRKVGLVPVCIGYGGRGNYYITQFDEFAEAVSHASEMRKKLHSEFANDGA